MSRNFSVVPFIPEFCVFFKTKYKVSPVFGGWLALLRAFGKNYLKVSKNAAQYHFIITLCYARTCTKARALYMRIISFHCQPWSLILLFVLSMVHVYTIFGSAIPISLCLVSHL